MFVKKPLLGISLFLMPLVAAHGQTPSTQSDTPSKAARDQIAQARTAIRREEFEKALMLLDQGIQILGKVQGPEMELLTQDALYLKGGVLAKLRRFGDSASVDECLLAYCKGDARGCFHRAARLDEFEFSPSVQAEFRLKDAADLLHSRRFKLGHLTYADIAERYKSVEGRPAIVLQAQKGQILALEGMGQGQEAAALRDRLLKTLESAQDRDSIEFKFRLVMDKAERLKAAGKPEDALRAFDEVLTGWKVFNESDLGSGDSSILCNARLAKGRLLLEQGQREVGHRALDEAFAGLGVEKGLSPVQQIEGVMNLLKRERNLDEVMVMDSLLARHSDHPDRAVRLRCLAILGEKSQTLAFRSLSTGNLAEAEACDREITRRLREDKDGLLTEWFFRGEKPGSLKGSKTLFFQVMELRNRVPGKPRQLEILILEQAIRWGRQGEGPLFKAALAMALNQKREFFPELGAGERTALIEEAIQAGLASNHEEGLRAAQNAKLEKDRGQKGGQNCQG